MAAMGPSGKCPSSAGYSDNYAGPGNSDEVLAILSVMSALVKTVLEWRLREMGGRLVEGRACSSTYLKTESKDDFWRRSQSWHGMTYPFLWQAYGTVDGPNSSLVTHFMKRALLEFPRKIRFSFVDCCAKPNRSCARTQGYGLLLPALFT